MAQKSNLMHNLFSVHFVNLYMFRAYLWPIISRYKRMYKTTGTYYSFYITVCWVGWFVPVQAAQL